MPSLQELRERRSAILTEMKAAAKLPKDEHRGFTADERKRLDALKAQDDSLITEIDGREKDIDFQKMIDGRDEELRQSLGRHVEPAAVNPNVPDPKKKFLSLGEQLQAVARASMPGAQSRFDARLEWQSFSTLSPSGASEGSPSDGGFLVDRDFSAEVLKRTYEYGEVLNRVRGLPISAGSNGLKINAVDETSRANGSRWGGVQVFWQNEADTPSAKKPKLRQMELNLKKLIGLAYATDELLADAKALESLFMQAFSEEFSFVLEDGVFNGTGAGQLLGILNSPALVTVAKETGQAAKTILKENIDKMWSRMWARSWRNAVFFINQDTLPQLQSLSQVVGVGGVPVYLPAGGMSQSPYGTLYGRPVIPVEYCATTGTVGDIILADLSQYLMIDKGGMQSASSIHVRFINDELTYRWVYRTDGQPIWHSVLTPKNGTLTLSPYVALAAR